MKRLELPLARIGNSRGIRLPADLIRKHGLEGGLLLEERRDALVLRPKPGSRRKSSWEETAREMAAADEDWSVWDGALADGLENCPWEYPVPTEQSCRVRELPSKKLRKTPSK
jgi:antitoxin component of MazEF toxin-antitoxin module